MLYSAVFSCVVCETRQLLVLPTTAIKMSPMLSMQQICQLWPVQQCHYYSNKCYVKSPTTISHLLHLLFTAAKTCFMNSKKGCFTLNSRVLAGWEQHTRNSLFRKPDCCIVAPKKQAHVNLWALWDFKCTINVHFLLLLILLP